MKPTLTLLLILACINSRSDETNWFTRWGNRGDLLQISNGLIHPFFRFESRPERTLDDEVKLELRSNQSLLISGKYCSFTNIEIASFTGTVQIGTNVLNVVNDVIQK